MRDVLLTGKVYEAVAPQARAAGRVYDAVVLDAPPTGRITRFLNVNAEVAGLAQVGPDPQPGRRGHGAAAAPPQTAVHLVTLLEEMPVQETADGIAELTRPGCRSAASSSTWCARRCCGRPTWPRRGQGDGSTRDAGRRGARRPPGVAVRSAERSSTRCSTRPPSTRSGSRWRSASGAPVQALGRPTYELPLLADGVDLGGAVRAGRATLRKQGVA